MFTALIDWTWRVRSRRAPGRVLEVGSRNVNGSVRDVFADAAEYVGIDAEPGAGVDIVMRGHQLGEHWPAEHFDTVLCYETLEHDPQFWMTLAAIRRVLRVGGFLFVTSPTFGFPLHRYPKDYYRFGEDAFREVVFCGYDLMELSEVRDSAGSPCLCGLGRKQNG
jgi:SAM-dependent methyltransferase